MTMRKALAFIWVAIPPLILSALVHSIDPDIGGIRGLASLSVFLSVVVYGSPVVAITLVCLRLAIRLRWIWWVSLSMLVSFLLALILTFIQTPGLEGFAGIARPLVGGTLLVWIFLAISILPARVLGWPRGGSRGERAA